MSTTSGSAFPLGEPLTRDDCRGLEKRWITPGLADDARLRRVNEQEGRSIVGLAGNMAGIAIPFYLPDGTGPVAFRIRRDQPDFAISSNGALKEQKKYVAELGRPNHVYFPPGLTSDMLQNTSLPLLIVEGEFKTLAANRLAHHRADCPRFAAIGITGVWNWKGSIGKEADQNGNRRNVKGVLPDFDRIKWAGRQVIIAFDADLRNNTSVQSARFSLSKELRERGAIVGFLEWDESRGKGLDDWLANEGPAPVLDAIEKVDFNRITGWQAKLICTVTGRPKAIFENVRIALETAPEFAGVLAFDEFAHRTMMRRPAPWTGAGDRPWTQEDDLELVGFLQRKGIEVGLDTAGQAVQLVATRLRFHPVREYLERCKWDRKDRVDSWLVTYLGAKDDPYTRTIGRCWLLSAVARIYDPGCKVDYLLVLEGPQGIGKSRGLRTLAGQFFTDSVPDFTSKDAALQLDGVWIVELSELDALSRMDLSTVKSFITRATDRYRRPYGKRPEDVPRQCVFAGTVNHDVYLKDETGGRRFWPVRCAEDGRSIDLEGLERDRDQFWAEAVALYREGHPWWPVETAFLTKAAEEQADRFDADPWTPQIESWLDGRPDRITVDQVLQFCIQKPLPSWTQADKNRVGRCLKSLGYVRRQYRDNDRRYWAYTRPDDADCHHDTSSHQYDTSTVSFA